MGICLAAMRWIYFKFLLYDWFSLGDSFYNIHPGRYLFPGAEVFYEPDEVESEDSSGSNSSEMDDSPSSSSLFTKSGNKRKAED